MPQPSEQVKAFFDRYERNIGASDAAAIAALYADSFVFAGPQGAQAVRRDDFLKVLPKRQEFFKTAGLRSSTIQALEEARLDDACVMVKAQWRLQFGALSAPPAAVDVSATYLLHQQPDGLRIVFQLDHQDLAQRVQELARRGACAP